MNMFYDAKKRQVRPWVYVAFILVPIVLILIGILGGQQIVEHDKNSLPADGPKKDIFE